MFFESSNASVISRRRLLTTTMLAGTAAASTALPAWGQSPKSRAWSFAQIADTSPAQQDVTKDFVNGVRSAIAEANQRGGVRGRRIQHELIETDGTPSSAQDAIKKASHSAQVLGLFGTVGDRTSLAVTQLLSQTSGADLCQCAPWLMASVPTPASTLSLFASHKEQVAHAIRSLNVIGMREANIVYARHEDVSTLGQDIRQATQQMQMQIREHANRGDWKPLAEQVAKDPAPVLLFVGGTPELIGFAQALGPQARQRFLVGLADVNLQSMLQIGIPKGLTVVATQVVPMVNSGIVIVRDFRAALARFFDEPPTAQGLSGYISARVTLDLVQQIDAAPSRDAVMAALKQVNTLNLDGFALARQVGERKRAFVTQSMLTADGRWIG